MLFAVLKLTAVIFPVFKMSLAGCYLQPMLSLPFGSGLMVNEIHRNVGRSETEKCTLYTCIILPGITPEFVLMIVVVVILGVVCLEVGGGGVLFVWF